MSAEDLALSEAGVDFAEIEAMGVVAAHESGFLTMFLKGYDWGQPAYRDLAQRIALWIRHESDEVRLETAVGLCFRSPPVAGLEWVALAGWMAAKPIELHWYASAIECSHVDSRLITTSVVEAVLRVLMRAPPRSEDFADESGYAYEQRAHAHAVAQAARVFNHFAKVIAGERIDGRDDPDERLDWIRVADVIRFAAKQQG